MGNQNTTLERIKKMKMIDMTPTWEAAVHIHCMVLENPDADPRVKGDARAELLRLARHVDKLKQQTKEATECR